MFRPRDTTPRSRRPRTPVRLHPVLLVLCLSLGLASLAPSPAPGDLTCTAFVDQWPFGPTRALSVDGSTAFVSSGAALLAVDLTTPASPEVVGTVAVGDPIWGVQVAGNLAILVDVSEDVFFVDVSDPTAMELVGTYTTTGSLEQPGAVAVLGNHALVATRKVGLLVLDTSDPSSPTLVATHEIPDVDIVFDVVVEGSLAYVAASVDGLRIVDVSDPLDPTEVGSFASSLAREVVVVGSTAYLADGPGGLRVLDVSNPAMPTEIGSLVTGEAMDVAVDGTRAYLTEIFSGLRVVDVTNPAMPMAVGLLPGFPLEVEVLDPNTVLVSEDATSGTPSMLRVVDVSTPTDPTEITELAHGHYTHDVEVAGDHAFVAHGELGLAVLALTGPDAPRRIGQLDHDGDAVDVVVAGTIVFIAADGEDLIVADVTDPSAPAELAQLDLTGSRSYELAHDPVGELLYVAMGGGGMRVVDVSTPASPMEIGSFVPTEGNVISLDIDGTRAVAVGGERGWLLDISNPAMPVEIAFFTPPDTARDVVLEGDRVYIAGDGEGFLIWSMENLIQPMQIGELTPFAVQARGVTVVGDRAYLAAAERYGMIEIDISDPTDPVGLGSFDTAGSARTVAVVGDRVYVADLDAGVTVLTCVDEIFADGFESGDASMWGS